MWAQEDHDFVGAVAQGSAQQGVLRVDGVEVGGSGSEDHWVLLYTDGIVGARSPRGEFFGDDRLADFVLKAAAAGEPAPETIRRLIRSVLAHQADQLQDDASIVMLGWRAGDEANLQL